MKKIRYIYFLFSIFLTFQVGAEDYDYNFSWLKIPVSQVRMSIINQSIFSENDGNIKFNIELLGPLKIIREYKSEIKINYNKAGWKYYLKGIDRGQSEEKEIHYFYEGAPKIIKFIDDRGASSLDVSLTMDNGAIDPLTVLVRTIKKLIDTQKCDGIYNIFDGKRRYKVDVRTLENTNINEMIQCKYMILSDKSSDDKNHLSSDNKWPFNKEGRSLDIWFLKKINYAPIKFIFDGPLGQIYGEIASEDNL